MRKIFRPTLTALVDDYAAGNLARTDYSQALNFQRLAKVFVTNISGSDIQVGDRVYVESASSVTYETMLSGYLSYGFYFFGTKEHSISKPYGFALEPIKNAEVGEIYLDGVVAATIDTVKDESDQYVRFKNVDGAMKLVTTPVKGIADFYKVSISSDTSEDKYLGYLVRKGKPGHLTGTIADQDMSGGETTTVSFRSGRTVLDTIEGVTCPLLRGGETIEAGSAVVVSWNESADCWQIIEAQCDDSSPSATSGDETAEGGE